MNLNVAATMKPSPRWRRLSRSRRKLLEAHGSQIRQGTPAATMTELAKYADVSVATAYRHFSSLEEVTRAYRTAVMTELRDYSAGRPETGRELLDLVTRFWIDLMIQHGPVMVQVRSPQGYLARLSGQVPSTVLGRESRERALHGVLAEMGLPADLIDDATMLYNTMFDPREILELLDLRKWHPDQVARVMLAAFLAALRAWGEAVVSFAPGKPEGHAGAGG